MEEKHPKRKKDSANPYTLSIENGIKYVSFEDREGYIQKIEISSALFSLFDEFELVDVSYMNVVSRHHEHSELTEQSLNDRAFQLPEPMEDTVSRIIENRRLIEAKVLRAGKNTNFSIGTLSTKRASLEMFLSENSTFFSGRDLRKNCKKEVIL